MAEASLLSHRFHPFTNSRPNKKRYVLFECSLCVGLPFHARSMGWVLRLFGTQVHERGTEVCSPNR